MAVMLSSAVNVENLSFAYKRHGLNLENISMQVPRGTIYGLLGPSGCGKTTLLRCIVGRLKARSGNVSVFGYRPGTRECGIPGPNIGYMPQELSLISQFTVRETLEYYAGFAKQNVHMQSLEKRINFLLKLLDISDFEHCYTDRLSGGQKRRVSLAVAMINEPPLLILDEPTVGVDPIVRESIWSYLVDQSKNGLTVIVTTHYIEEAGSADKVGFMRQGRILAEGNPNFLMLKHQVISMERLFLKLSQQDDHKNQSIESKNKAECYAVKVDGKSNCEQNQVGENAQAACNQLVSYGNGSASFISKCKPNSLSMHLIHGPSQQRANHIMSAATTTEHYKQLDPDSLVDSPSGHLHVANNNNDNINNNNNNNINNNNNNNTEYSLENETRSSSTPPIHHSSVNMQDVESDAPLFSNSSSSSNNSSSCSSSSSCRNNKKSLNSSNTSLSSSKTANAKATATTKTVNVSNSPSPICRVVNNSQQKSRTYSVHGQNRSVNSVHKIGVLCRKHRIRLFRRVPELVITMLLPALEVALFCLCMGRDPTSVQMAVCNQENPPFLSLLFLKSIDSDFISLKYYKTPEEAIDSVRNADTYSAIVLAKNFSNELKHFSGQNGMMNAMPRLTLTSHSSTGAGATLSSTTTPSPRPVQKGISSSPMSAASFVTNTNEPVPPLMTPYIAPSQPTQSMLLVKNDKDSPVLATDNAENNQNELRVRMKRNISELLATTAVTSGGMLPNGDDDSIIRIYYDGSNALHVNIIRREVFSALFRFVEIAGKTLGGHMNGYKLPIKFEKPIYGGEKTDMVEFVGPGLMVFIVFFATMSITSMAFLSERREGTLERSMIVGMTPTEFIIAQIINITFLLIVQITLTVVMGFWIFDFPMKGSYILAVAMMFLQGLCGMTFGLMLSAICTSEMTALALGAGSQLMFCFITGIFWPVETMITLLRYISYAMPQTKPMESFRHILIRGFDLSKPAVLNGYLITLAWIAFFLVLAIVIFRVR